MHDIKLERKTAERVADRIMKVKRQSEEGGIRLWVYTSKTTGGIVVIHETTQSDPYQVLIADTDTVPTVLPAQKGTGTTVREAIIDALT